MPTQGLEYSKGTISIELVHEALVGAKTLKHNIPSILHASGIPAELLNSSKTRVSVTQYAALWTTLSDVMNDEFFGMDQHAMRRGSFKLLSKMVMYNDNLGNALKQILQFLNLVLDDLQSSLIIEEHYAYIVIYDQKATKRMFSYATYLMLIHTLICWLSGQRIILNQIQLKCDEPYDDHDYKVRFCEKIQYQATQNYIQFDASYLNLPIKQDDRSWYQFLQQTPDNLLVRFKNPYALSSQIRKQLVEVSPAEWLELNELALKMNMSEATMQRRLKSEGVSYQQLKNDIRRDTAIEFLTRTDKSLQDISDELNFHEPSAFHRAFKKWTGVSPGAYRQNNIE
ncbi:AraC family transcriptional regulator [Acinetobacter sp. ANC 5054]|uniref:AraC family transcriptional regulator n=1 Tax=Acinetobacter sp. ANC 5054 TaxID=1977877 RepID=UPI001BB46C38|nr:AraC family transcriptional regulator [Acinetobacter sp. ANC 5054]